MRHDLLGLLVIAALGVGCADATSSAEVLSGEYHYVALDSNDVVFHEGTLRLEFHDDLAVTGHWNTTFGTGLGSGAGTVVGEMLRGKQGWSVNLHLDVSSTDNDMVVDADLGMTYSGFAGTWSYADLAGETMGGQITAWKTE